MEKEDPRKVMLFRDKREYDRGMGRLKVADLAGILTPEYDKVIVVKDRLGKQRTVGVHAFRDMIERMYE